MPVNLLGKEISLRQGILLLWLVQLGWLTWHFAPEALDLTQRLASGRTGEVVRQEDAYYRWLEEVKTLIPPGSTYIFVDCYEAGKDIAARYLLYPRKLVNLNPLATPSVLFEKINKEQAGYLVLRECNLYPQWQFLFQPDNPVFQPLPASGPGLVFRVDPYKVTGGFYD
jgi:hypothetical protein